LIFKPEDTLSFLGTVRLTVLQGSILLFGSPLYASPVVHSVFAPKSYPVATISVISESSDGYSSASKSSSPSDRIEASTLPQNIRSAISSSDVIIKVQDSNSGVQELGNICSEHLVSFKALPEFDFDFKLREFFPVSTWYLFKKGITISSLLSPYFSFYP
jgi:polynucleotide 5'-hydroxyl-kinase GRC3/NOL9